MYAGHNHYRPLDTPAILKVQVPTIFIVDPDAAARESLSFLIHTLGWQTECFASAEEFLARPRSETGGCLLIDVALPRLDGLELQQIVADRRELPVVFVTGQYDVGMSVRAMKAGAVDFLTKPASHQAVLGAIRCALDRSRRALADETSLRMVRDRYERLTRREQEVMTQVAAGLPNKVVAAKLGVCEITVKVHRGNLMRKMQADSFAALVRMAARLGLRSTDSDRPLS